MSRQADTPPEVVKVVVSCGTPVGIILGGSVAEGRERSDSDLDLFAVVDSEDHPDLPGFSVISVKNGCKVFERKGSQFPVHVACWTTTSMEEILRVKPYMMYPYAIGRIVYDPSGIAHRFQSQAEAYFGTRPRLASAWDQQLRDLRDSKAGTDGAPAFPQWSDFVRHIEATLQAEIAE